jgi:glycosyltransferase involved in cell wall biosynthesis
VFEFERGEIGHGAPQPLVTVAMPIYNAGKYLRLAVLSIVKQTFTNWEFLIIDDGSTDNALQYIADIHDARIRIFRDGENKGLAVRLNECIDLAQGKYFARMDHDDVSYPERFMQQVAALEENRTLDVVAVRAVTIDERNKVTALFPSALTHAEICAKPWRGFHFPHPAWMGRIEWFRKHRYTVPAPYFCEDQELLLRSYRNSRFGTLDAILFAYRVRSKVDWRKLARTRRTIFIAQLRYFASLNIWHCVLLATAAYAGKMGGDLLKRLRGNFPRRPVIVDDVVVLEWDTVSGGLAAVSKVP